MDSPPELWQRIHIAMNHFRLLSILLAASLAASAPRSFADDQAPNDSEKEQPEAEAKEETNKKADKPNIRSGSIEKRAEKEMSIDNGKGGTLTYTVTTAMMPLENSEGKMRAEVFHTYYQVESDQPRPLVFCFNGGPGASSVWLHLGGIAPYRANLPGDGTTQPKPPFGVVENPHTILKVADLVFVDPVTTGYSRGKDKKAEKDFHGVEEDLAGNSEFIRRFIAHHKLWKQPIFLMGESYGVFRVCALAFELSSSYGIRTSGLLLISGLVDFQTILTSGSNDLPYALYLPTLTRVAIYHGKLNPTDPEALVAEAKKFAETEYLAALHLGHQVSAEQRQNTIEKLHSFTAIPKDIIDRADLRISATLFRGTLLDADALNIGRFDARVKGSDLNRVQPYAEGDPSYDLLNDLYSTAIQTYLVETLEFKADENKHYRTLTGEVGPWNYGKFKNRYAQILDRLQQTIQSNPDLRIFIAGGLYDLATPVEGLLYSLNRIDLPNEDSLILELYQGGHMMYSNPSALEKLSADLRKFISETTPE